MQITTQMSENLQLLDLPFEILLHIFQDLEVQELYRLSTMSNLLFDVCHHLLHHKHHIETVSFNFNKVEIPISDRGDDNIMFFYIDSSLNFINALKYHYMTNRNLKFLPWKPFSSEIDWWKYYRIYNYKTHLKICPSKKYETFATPRIRRNVQRRWEFLRKKTKLIKITKSVFAVVKML